MHADERPLDVPFVRRLLAGQFPALSGLALSPVASPGSDNAMYRLGDELVVRLPRWRPSEAAGVRLEKECRWLPWLAPRLPLPIPAVVGVGEPADGYPFRWAVISWLQGEPARLEAVGDQERAAGDLARFLTCLQAVDPSGGPAPGPHNAFRGVPLAERDESTREAIRRVGPMVEEAPILAAWEDAVTAPEWNGAPRWIHGDLDPRNVLVRGGRVSAVVDFGCLGVGDPACDAMAAWKLFPAKPREVFRRELGADDATWARGRGWAISQAMSALSYYTQHTNPVLIGEARRWLAEALADI
jgi:aminoglycoside phosphotransferase (APT) family kinase protein